MVNFVLTAGSLNTPGQSAELALSNRERQQAGDHLNIKVPKSIEEVPFRFKSAFERNLDCNFFNKAPGYQDFDCKK